MSSTENQSNNSGPLQNKSWIQPAAALTGVLLYLGIIIFHLLRKEPLTFNAFLIYLAVIAPALILIVFLLMRFLCGENLSGLNLKPGKFSSDLIPAVILSPIILIVNVISRPLLSELFPEGVTDYSVRNLMTVITDNTGLLILFLGVLILIGAASEEIVRVFLLSRFWKAWPSLPGKLIGVFISACLFGLIHIYQGPAGAAGAGLIGLLMAFYYLRFGRLVPLILAHYFTNSFQVILFALAAG